MITFDPTIKFKDSQYRDPTIIQCTKAAITARSCPTYIIFWYSPNRTKLVI